MLNTKHFLNIFALSKSGEKAKKAKRLDMTSECSIAGIESSFGGSSTNSISSKEFELIDNYASGSKTTNTPSSTTNGNQDYNVQLFSEKQNITQLMKTSYSEAKEKKPCVTEIVESPVVKKPRKKSWKEHKEEAEPDYILLDNKPFLYSFKDWVNILKQNDLYKTNSKTIKDSLRNGIPKDLRGKIWIFLTRSSLLAEKYNKDVYKKLLLTPDEDVDYSISKDLHRTFPRLGMFTEDYKEGKNKLFNVLKAYSAYDSAVKYCQGTNYIVGLLLLSIPDEEMVFWTFVQIMNDKNWRDVYTENTPKLMSMLESLKAIIKKELPDIYRHMRSQDIEVETCFSQVFITLFIYYSPMEVANRIFDLFLVEGEKILFRVVKRMLQLKAEKILTLDTEQLNKYLRGTIVKECTSDYSIKTLFLPQ